MGILNFYHKKIYPNIYLWRQQIDAVSYKRYARKLVKDFSHFTSKKKKGIMLITEGEFFYEYFNFCYLHNILSLMLYAMKHNYIPRIAINQGKSDIIQWEWHFKQPFSESTQSMPVFPCPRKATSFLPHFMDIYSPEMRNLWSTLYRQCIQVNEKTQGYFDQEYERIFSKHSRILGVICRGTDYLTLKPAGHPVQPSVEEVISHCQEHMKQYSYDAIYLATEERQIRDAFCQAFPNMILENKRSYYDDIYYNDQSIRYIKDVHFNRDNNNYWRGLEYFSSINLLSQCTSLIGGNCGGTLAAVLLNDGAYEYTHIFNLGLYP